MDVLITLTLAIIYATTTVSGFASIKTVLLHNFTSKLKLFHPKYQVILVRTASIS